jgi:large conductance mechanosensitive channel protein
MLDSLSGGEKRFFSDKEWNEYKRFAFRDDMLKLTVGMMLGSSFNKVISSISSDLVMPAMSFLTTRTGDGWREMKLVIADGLEIRFGRVAGEFLDFLVVSVVLYIVWVKVVGRMKNAGGDTNSVRKEGDENERGSGVENKGTKDGGGEQEGTHGAVGKDRGGSSDAGKPDSGPDGDVKLPRHGRKKRGTPRKKNDSGVRRRRGGKTDGP